MKVKYRTKALERVCTNIKEAKKQYSRNIPEKLLSVINYIEIANYLKDIVNYPPFHFHGLDGDRKGQYAIDIGGRRSGYRLIIAPMNDDGTWSSKEEVFSNASANITIVCVEEVSNHYE